MDYGVWSMKYGVWSMEYGVWSVDYGVWSMEYDYGVCFDGVLSMCLGDDSGV